MWGWLLAPKSVRQQGSPHTGSGGAGSPEDVADSGSQELLGDDDAGGQEQVEVHGPRRLLGAVPQPAAGVNPGQGVQPR